jgi:serine/threonine protein kinase
VDWWAVGVIAYELLAGNPPFNASSMQNLYDRILHKDVKLVLGELGKVAPDVSNMTKQVPPPPPPPGARCALFHGGQTPAGSAERGPGRQLIAALLERTIADRLGAGEADVEVPLLLHTAAVPGTKTSDR